METTTVQAQQAIDPVTIRRALNRNTYGASALGVYGIAADGGRLFRMYDFKTKHGTPYGRELSTGKWVAIVAWEKR